MTKSTVLKGRILADGSRTTPRQRVRVTVYLSPDVARVLSVTAVATGRERSDVVNDAVRAALGMA